MKGMGNVHMQSKSMVSLSKSHMYTFLDTIDIHLNVNPKIGGSFKNITCLQKIEYLAMHKKCKDDQDEQ